MCLLERRQGNCCMLLALNPDSLLTEADSSSCNQSPSTNMSPPSGPPRRSRAVFLDLSTEDRRAKPARLGPARPLGLISRRSPALHSSVDRLQLHLSISAPISSLLLITSPAGRRPSISEKDVAQMRPR